MTRETIEAIGTVIHPSPTSGRLSLADLAPGARAVVLQVSGDEQSQLRLQGLGIRRGVDLECLQGGSGKPVMVKVLESRLALNSDLAALVRVRKI